MTKPLTLGPIYLCDKAPRSSSWVGVAPGQPCPFCKRPLAEHKTAGEAGGLAVDRHAGALRRLADA